MWRDTKEKPTAKDNIIIAIKENGAIDRLYFKKKKWCHADWDFAGFYPVNIDHYTHWLVLSDLPPRK